jgi:hypothetical protein
LTFELRGTLAGISVMKLWQLRPFNMNDRERIRLRHMRDAAKEALSFLKGRTREDLTRDRMLLLA